MADLPNETDLGNVRVKTLNADDLFVGGQQISEIIPRVDGLTAEPTADSTSYTADDTIYRLTSPVRDGIDNVADVVIYSTTPAGIATAVRLAMAGFRPVIVGGWRDRHPGGVVSGGLGYTDIGAPLYSNPYGGLLRRFLREVNIAAGIGGNIALTGPSEDSEGASLIGPVRYFGPAINVRKRLEPRYAEQVFTSWLNQYGIPVYWSGGIASAQKVDGRVVSITTVDGQTIRGKYFVEASYEGDLIAKAGISWHAGRSAASSLSPNDGYRGAALTDKHQFPDSLRVDPFVVPGVQSSGLLPGLKYETETVGQADDERQAYCFRMIMTKNPDRIVPTPSTPPVGYNALDYEVLIRYMVAVDAAGAYATTVEGITRYFEGVLIFATKLIGSTVSGTAIRDVNSGGPISIDLVGGSKGYVEASYAERQVIWEKHRRWIQGFFYTIQYLPDARVPSLIRNEALLWGFDKLHFTEPYFGDPMYWPYQLYIREGRLMVGDYVHTESDMSAVDGTTPRLTTTIATASYPMDKHQHQRLAVPVGDGTWAVKNEGEVFQDGGGVDEISPLPYELVLPKRAECRNLLSITAPSCTSIAFGEIRMEPTFMALGEGCGAALTVALRTGGTMDVQDVPYTDIRAELAISTELVKPVVPQIN